jgi:galactokinase
VNASLGNIETDMGAALHSLQGRAESIFCERFGSDPSWVTAAPGRVNIIGEHIDYNDGFVLPMTIQRYACIAAGPAANPSPGRLCSIYSETLDELVAVETDYDESATTPGWVRYIRGVLAGCDQLDMRPDEFDCVVVSSVPLGGGLSSSAALEVATATLVEAMCNSKLDPLQKARLCQTAEHDYAGVPCGLMDQYAAVFGSDSDLILMDCRDETSTNVVFDDPSVSLLVFDTNVKHDLATDEYGARRAECSNAADVLGVQSLRDVDVARLDDAQSKLDESLFRRTRHVVTETARALDTAQWIRDRNWAAAGEAMYASHESLRSDYEVSCPELDAAIELAQKLSGVYGARMTGGGFGGCAILLVDSSAASKVGAELARVYKADTGISGMWFATRPGGGARVLRRPANAGDGHTDLEFE